MAASVLRLAENHSWRVSAERLHQQLRDRTDVQAVAVICTNVDGVAVAAPRTG